MSSDLEITSNHFNSFDPVKWLVSIVLILLLSACNSGGGGGGKEKGVGNSAENENFVTFESGQVRPLAISQDGTKLIAVNTPNSTIEIFSIDSDTPAHSASVAVGMEPVAVSIAENGLAWVVNHLSDSISIVDIDVNPPHVIQTLLVGDEPRDVVFAGASNRYAFITTAHRGQNGPADQPVNAQLTDNGVGRADVWVFDTTDLGNSLGGDPANVITLFGDTPRALAVSPDGNTVYAAVFLSGNKTTTIGANALAKPGPLVNVQGLAAPQTGLIVKNIGNDWVDGDGNVDDQAGQPWSDKVMLQLPDFDVFEIDATANPPVANVGGVYAGVGTVLFNMIANPSSGAVYVTNTEALNHIRFEGPGNFASTVRGHFAESRITVIKDGSVTPIHLNKHIDHTNPAGTTLERQLALANPLGMAITDDGSTLFVTGFGSQKIGVYNTSQLENDTFQHTSGNQIALSAGGPSGLALDQDNSRLYVLTRFDNSISVINTQNNAEIAHISMFNPEPSRVVNGRKFLYDATLTSSHGDSSCGLCHVFGDFDGLAWDLGNPDGDAARNPNPFAKFLGIPIVTLGGPRDFHPMKGPMTTQSLRGLKGNGPMHWRGDRTGETRALSDSVEFGAFMDFNVAFPDLVGRDEELSTADMRAFTQFALEITYPPNPIRSLDNGLTPNQAEGRRIYMEDETTGVRFQCNTCHTLNVVQGHFGTSGLSSFEGDEISQDFKVPHLRNIYQKVGKFGASGNFLKLDPGEVMVPQNQIKGFGFMHDGAMDTLAHFFNGDVFEFDPNNTTRRDQVISFVFAMDSELAPVVGQQITLRSDSAMDTRNRVDLLINRALVLAPRPECDLIVKGVINGEARGGVMLSDSTFMMDRQNQVLTATELRSLVNVNNNVLTFMCVPPGSGNWMGIDRDLDGILDGDES